MPSFEQDLLEHLIKALRCWRRLGDDPALAGSPAGCVPKDETLESAAWLVADLPIPCGLVFRAMRRHRSAIGYRDSDCRLILVRIGGAIDDPK